MSAKSQRAEMQMVRRREKEHQRQTQWGNQVRYYDSWGKANNKFEEWTSPRYYETSNRMIDDLKKKKEKEEKLEVRRERLRKLLHEEETSFAIEQMVTNRDKLISPRRDEIPIELLKDVNVGLKLAEDERTRHEAEINLYHQWRSNNPIVRDHERKFQTQDLKLSWLDQQIEKRMEKERSEEECRKMVAERQERVKKEKEEEERCRSLTEARNKKLREDLEEQIEELHNRQRESDILRKQEEENVKIKSELNDLEEKRQEELRRRSERERALDNVKQYKLKLKRRACEIQEALDYEKGLIERLANLKAVETIEDATKRREIQRAMDEFLNFAREQKELEKSRQRYLDFIFDSEARGVFEKQQEIWSAEERAREELLKDVIAAIKVQAEEKVESNKAKQKEVLGEREVILKRIEEFNEGVRREQEAEAAKRFQLKEGLDRQVKEKKAGRKEAESLEQRQLDRELEAARREEERLKKEIMNLQKRQGPYRPTRSRIFF